MLINNNRGNICCIADSNYQLLNILSVIYHQINVNNNDIDLYVYANIIERNELLFKKIKDIWGIKNVYKIFVKDDHSIGQIFRRFFNPNQYVIERTDNTLFRNGMYDGIYLAVPNHFSLSIVLCNQKAGVNYYEDGTASYFLDLIKWEYPLYQRVLYFLVGNHLKKAYPNKIYLNNVKMYIGGMSNNVCQNLLIDENDICYKNMIKAIFPIDVHKYLDKKTIYFTQPLYTIKGYNSKVKTLLDDVENHIFSMNRLILRIHPLDKSDYNLPENSLDRESGSWEIVCEEAVSNNSVLVGYYSTAQFTPTLLFKKEPYILFLYKLLPELYNGYKLVQMEKTVSLLESQYKDKRKIMIPKSMEEMIDMMDGIDND